MKRAANMELDLPPATPTQAALCEEFGEWCDRHGFARIPGDNPMLLNLLDRRQRQWLSSFIARWDWAGEDEAREPDALCTPLELAATFVAVAREHSSRGEFARVRAGALALGDYLDVRSVLSLAFARLHRVSIDAARTPRQQLAEAGLKAAALAIAERFMIHHQEV